ncbi:hypothetical protein MHK_004726 [Candidatus Magnetomorum sp. HK-1]|nr:hypothetical protein MHK_004726 [Candidatus Magnetomorum sp. HK-1]
MKNELMSASHAALAAMLPSIEAYNSFRLDNDGESIDSIIQFACKQKLIQQESESALKSFIEKNASLINIKSANKLTISGLKSKLNPYRVSVSSINQLLETFEIKINPVYPSIFTTLAKKNCNTNTERNAVRLISFWVCYEQKDLLSTWNYNELLKLVEGKKSYIKERVRVGFSLYSKGIMIGQDILAWMKKELNEIIHSANTVKPLDISGYYIDFYAINNLNYMHPSIYRQALNEAVSLAYQMSVRWLLSEHYNPDICLSIGITAGGLSVLEKTLFRLLNTKLTENAIIRMTDYTRQCVLMNDIRLIFCKTPKEVDLQGEISNLWWVSGFWNTLYWDFIPIMLKENTLLSNSRLKQLLWFYDQQSYEKEKTGQTDSLLTYFQYPQLSMLGMEIAKLLFYRKKFSEALEILQIIISESPENTIARALKITIFWNKALESTSYSIAKQLFDRADEEALIVPENLKDEDFFSEYAFSKLAHALTIFRLIQKNGGAYKKGCIQLNKNHVYKMIEEIQYLYNKALAISATGNCSIFWLLCINAFRETLKQNEDCFASDKLDFKDVDDTFRKSTEEFMLVLGWLSKDKPVEGQWDFVKTIMYNAISTYDDSVSLRTYIPNLKYCYAVFIWDFCQNKSYNDAIIVLQWLEEAIYLAKQLHKDKLCIYSCIKFCGYMLTSSDFIQNVKNVIQAIESRVGNLASLKAKSPEQRKKQINIDLIKNLKLSLLNIFFPSFF